jgi:hypothetical protein
MKTADAIMLLFKADDVVLRPSEVVRRTGKGLHSVVKELSRLVVAGKLFHIAHSQYARCATTKPIAAMRSDRIGALERRVEQLERLMSDVVP